MLRRLAEQAVVIEPRIGGRYPYVANREHILWPAVEVFMSAADRLDTTIREHVEAWEVPALSVELFGSVAACDRCLGILAAAPALAVSPASASTATYSVQYLTLGNGQKVVARWNPCRTHTYKVNLASVPTATRTTVLAETQAALKVLATKTGISFTYKGATTEVPRLGSHATQSADIIIAFTTPLKSNYLYGTADARRERGQHERDD